MYIFKKDLNESNIVETINSIKELKSISDEIKTTILDILYEAKEEFIEDPEAEITINIKIDSNFDDDKKEEINDITDIEDVIAKEKDVDEDKLRKRDFMIFDTIFGLTIKDIIKSDVFSSQTKEYILKDVLNIAEVLTSDLFDDTEEYQEKDKEE